MIRKKKKYTKPRKPFEKTRIEEEDSLARKYALKNKHEIWKTLAKVNYYRSRAKALARSPLEEQQILFNKLKDLGLNINSISDILDLKVEDFLERRLPTILAKKRLANTIKQARQLVVHKKVLISNKVIDSPSYLVPINEEGLITIKSKEK